MTAATRARTALLSVCADVVGDRRAPAALALAGRLARRGATLALWGVLFAVVALAWLATAALAMGQACASWTWSLLSRWVPLLLRGTDAAVRWAEGQARYGWESFRDGRVERLAARSVGGALERLPAAWEWLDGLAGTLRVCRAAAVPLALLAWERVR